MRKLSFLKSTISFVLLLSMSILLTSCSSSSDDDPIDITTPTGNVFNPADFALTITRKQLNNDYLAIDFDVKYTSKTSYLVYEQGAFSVKFTVKTTDGEVFQRITSVDYVEAGVTSTGYVHLNFTAGKTLDLSTLTGIIVKD
jgi:hypothetical protein